MEKEALIFLYMERVHLNLPYCPSKREPESGFRQKRPIMMKPKSNPSLVLSILFIALAGLIPNSAFSQSTEGTGKQSLTFQLYPYQFNSRNPLTPESEILLQFNAPVEPSAAEKSLILYDKPNDRFAPIKASRPTTDEIKELRKSDPTGIPEENFVLIRPSSPLPLNGTWYLNARAGLNSSNGTNEIIESRLQYVGNLAAFTISKLISSNEYNSPMRIRISHNKSSLQEKFDAKTLAEYITISPEPDNFSIDPGSYQIMLDGDFEYGEEYSVTVKSGLIANDTTQLEQVFSETTTFVPNEGFITYPAFSTTQNASGHRHFDVKTGNLTGLRTRVKSLSGDNLILAMREYDEKYEGWGEKQTVPFATVPGETIYDSFQDPTAKVDTTETVTLDWNELAGEEKTGAFYLCSEGRSATREQLSVGAQSLIQLTDIGLAWKQSDEGTVLYGFSLQSGNPLPGMKIRIVDENAKLLAETTTGENGIGNLEASAYKEKEGKLYLDSQLGEDRHVIQFFEDLETVGLWNFNVQQRWDDLIDGERRTLLFVDRNVYKPGEEVKLKAISRFIDADKLLGPGSGAATLRVYDARHRKIVEKDVQLGENGSFDDSFKLPAAGLGWHSIELDFNPKELGEDEHPDWRLIAHHSFQVEEYRVNTFEVNLDSKESYTLTDKLEIPVSANYYMGKSLSKAELTWNAYANNQYPRPRGFDEFEFGDRIVDFDSFSTDGKGTLTSKGEATISFELPEQDAHPGPRSVSVTAQVTDANQQTISNSTRFTVHSSDFYLGMRLPEGVHRAGDTATFSVAAVSTKGDAYTNEVSTTVLVEKAIWNTVKVRGANGRMTHRNEKRLEMVSEETFALKTAIDPETGLTKAMPYDIKFADAGDYEITITARDAEERPVITKCKFTVIGAEEPSWSWYDVIRIDMTPDKTTYKVGDTAKILVRSPVFGHALLTTERGGVRSAESIMIDQYETVVEVPIKEGDAPNLFASILIVRGSEESPHIHTSADYRMGYCQLEVDDPASHLSSKIDTGNREYYQPGEEVTLSTTITDAEGNPVEGAEVTFFAVDEGVLSLTGHRTPDPHDVFHDIFPLSVFTGQSLRSLLPENPQEQDFANKGYVIGGGGANNGLDPDRVRKDFKPLAFWQPALITDAAGVVSTTFTAPDNLTEFRVMAVVADGNRFGHSEAPLVINKPLIIEPALPGFTNVTDQIDLSAVLHNNTGKQQEVEITVALDDHATFVNQLGETLKTNLPSSADNSTRTAKLFLNPGATETISFPAALVEVGESKWNWKVRSITEASLRDATESTIQVGYPLPLLRESHTFAIRDEQDLENALRSVAPRLLNGRGDVEVTLSNSRLVEAADAIDYLLKYPYGCVEQTTSSLIPWLSTQQLQKVMPQLDKKPAEIDRAIKAGIERLFSMQTSDGGLGYWPGSNDSVLWGSAYGGVAIAYAQKQGIEVPEEQTQALWNYLSKNLRESGDLKEPYQLSQRCLASYTLALAGVNETSYHELFYSKRNELSSEARSLLALAMIESGTDAPERIATLLSPDTRVPVAEVSWYKTPYIAATRLLAQVRHDPKSNRVEDLVNDLMKLRKPQRGWGSTYSNAWPLIALSAYSEATAKSMSANEIEVAFGEESKNVSLAAEPGSKQIAFTFDGDVSDRGLSINPANSAPVYASVQIATRPELIPIEPENNGFGIHRNYQKVKLDGSLTEAENLEVGDLILVTLDVNLPNERESYLAIDDPLPAIFEAVNPKFKSQATQKVDRDRKIRRLYANHTEMQKDRVVFFADSVFNAGDYTLQYLARVVAPGVVTAPPAKIEAMYEPQRFGLSGTEQIKAKAKTINTGEVAVR